MNAGRDDGSEQGRTVQTLRPLPTPVIPAAPVDRVRLAARDDGPPEAMRELAHDPDMIVRAALAINGACNPEVDAVLARDADVRVRALLGSRIARQLPRLGRDVPSLAGGHVRGTLALLARDQAVRVRAAVANEIKALDTAPRDLVLLLARDDAVEVSAPILRQSPLLTDGDLVSLLTTPPFPGSAEAIASRPRLSATVADAIVSSADPSAIRTLLANRSACIPDATLESLIARAPNHVDWHAPLVRRPALSAKAVRALSEFIAVDLLRVLAARADLDPAKLGVLRRRLDAEAPRLEDTVAMAEARLLWADKGVGETSLLQALRAGDTARALALLAVASGTRPQALERIVALRNAEALVSVVWRAGFTMRAGTAVQTELAHLGPNHALEPNASGGFPLTDQEMERQVERVRAAGIMD